MAETKQPLGDLSEEVGEQALGGVTGATPVPCKNCTSRYPACHDSCQQYKDFKASRELIGEKRRQELIFGARLHEAITNKLITDWRKKQ